jgi:signal transduction histidine kinase
MSKIYYWCREVIRRVGLRLLLVLAGYVLLSALAIALTDNWMSVLAEQSARIVKAQDTISILQQLRINLLQAESAQRGYLINLQNGYAQTLDDTAHEKQVRETLRALEANLESKANEDQNRHHDALLRQVTAAVEGKLTELQMSTALAHKGKMEAATQMLTADDHGKTKMMQFMDDTESFIDAENKALKNLSASRDLTMSVGRFSVAASVLLVLILVVLAMKKLIEEIADRDRLSQKLETDVVNFEQKLEEHTSMLKTLAVDYQYDVERERRKLARELHDELGSILTATKMDISWVLRKIKDTSPEASEKLARTIRYLDQGIQLKRRVVEDLHPSLLSTLGLIPALKSLIESVAERNQWKLNIVLPDETAVINEAQGLIAYRVVQETLNNATKYAQATKVSVHLQVDEHYLKLEIEDNGKGMDMTQEIAVTHGLKGMRHRVIAIGGKLQIESEPGKGMFTVALIPLNAPSAPPAQKTEDG